MEMARGALKEKKGLGEKNKESIVSGLEVRLTF